MADEQSLTSPFVFEGVASFDSENGGASRFTYGIPASAEDEKHQFGVTLVSEDERVWDGLSKEEAHPFVRLLEGKRVRITVEILDA